jgi:DNA-binding response OmpR family regulator
MVDRVPAPAMSPGKAAPVIVVAEDDDATRALLVRTLGTKYTVYEARNGQQARELLAVLPTPDLIVSDVMMPGLDGLGLARLTRKDPVLKNVPIILLTAKDHALDVIAGINAGARHYMTKPFKIAELMAKVESIINKKR